jgi:hypothetical protein
MNAWTKDAAGALIAADSKEWARDPRRGTTKAISALEWLTGAELLDTLAYGMDLLSADAHGRSDRPTMAVAMAVSQYLRATEVKS